MFNKSSLQDWEAIVQKQLKTEDIYSVLSKENLEGVVVKPYLDSVNKSVSTLPKVEESTQLVASYSDAADDNTYAFLLNENVEELFEKVLYINNKELAEHIQIDESNRYISLIDVFSEDAKGELDAQLVRELIAKDFERSICVDISLHQNAGASIVQQLAVALAKIKDLAESVGSEVLNKIVIRTAVGGNYFFEIAKIRALKTVVRTLFKEFNENSFPYIFAETSLRNKSAHDPENNLIRSTLELSAAMIGGADAVFSNDYRLSEGDTLSEEISFKQQIVLAYESIINVFDDAANGSYAIEDLTRQFAEQSWQQFLKMETQGGYGAMLRSGTLQSEIYAHAVEEQRWAEEGKLPLVGVNLYPKREVSKSVLELYDPTVIRAVRLSEMFE